jgi:hypothetical protein
MLNSVLLLRKMEIIVEADRWLIVHGLDVKNLSN